MQVINNQQITPPDNRYQHTVSVIVPCYNVGKYVRKSIESILRQSYRNLEVIAINDASTDDTLRRLHRLRENDERLHIIDHSVNRGVDISRFDGIRAAKGTHVAFVDGDDWLEPDAIETLVKIAIEENADVVEGRSNRVIGRLGLIRRPSKQEECRTITQPELFNEYYCSFFGYNRLSVSLWGKIYRMSLFKDEALKPSGRKHGEDMMLNLKIFPKINRYVTSDRIVYNYRWGGMTSRYIPTFYDGFVGDYFYKMELLKDSGRTDLSKWLKIEFANIFVGECLQRVGRGDSDEEITAFIRQESKKEPLSTVIRDVTAKTGLRSLLWDSLAGRSEIQTFIAALRKDARRRILRKYLLRIIAGMI